MRKALFHGLLEGEAPPPKKEEGLKWEEVVAEEAVAGMAQGHKAEREPVQETAARADKEEEAPAEEAWVVAEQAKEERAW